MTDLEKFTLCRLAEQKRLYNLTLPRFNKTHTARFVIMTEILKEEQSWKNITKKESLNG